MGVATQVVKAEAGPLAELGRAVCAREGEFPMITVIIGALGQSFWLTGILICTVLLGVVQRIGLN